MRHPSRRRRPQSKGNGSLSISPKSIGTPIVASAMHLTEIPAPSSHSASRVIARAFQCRMMLNTAAIVHRTNFVIVETRTGLVGVGKPGCAAHLPATYRHTSG
jgi:hypothetical protein